MLLAVVGGSVAWGQVTSRVEELKAKVERIDKDYASRDTVDRLVHDYATNAALYRPRLESVEKAQGITDNRMENVADSLREVRKTEYELLTRMNSVSISVARIEAKVGSTPSAAQ